MKLDFDQVIELINDQRGIDSSNVRADALQRKVWIAEWHIPGCLSESFSVCMTKADAIDCVCEMADNPRGMRTSLRKYGRFDSDSPMFGRCINTVEKRTISDII